MAAASQRTRTSAERGARAVRETVADMGEIKTVVASAARKVQTLTPWRCCSVKCGKDSSIRRRWVER